MMDLKYGRVSMGRKSRAKRAAREKPLPPAKPRTVSQDLRWGAKWGLFAGLVYVVFAACVLLLKGGVPDSAPARVTPLTVLSVYPVAGVIGGLIVGTLRPLTKERKGAMMVGAIAAVPACVGFLLLMSGPLSEWGGAEVFSLIISSVILGGMGGYKFWGLQFFDPNAFLRSRGVLSESGGSGPGRE